MPRRVRAFCYFGKYHDIEVDDDVTAYVEYENGATGLFVTTTGEAPGTNRLEVTGDCGKIVVEGGKLTFWRNRVPADQFRREFQGGFGSPECWKCEVPVRTGGGGHREVTQKWIDAIRKGTPLVAPGEEGIRSLEISNAILLSAWTDAWVDIPVDEDLFYEKLQERVQASTHRKKGAGKTMSVDGTFSA
jgi:predicted dehydrogenase